MTRLFFRLAPALLAVAFLASCESPGRDRSEDFLDIDPDFGKAGIIEMSIYPPAVPEGKGAPFAQSLRDATCEFLTQRRSYTVVAQKAVEKALAVEPASAQDADAVLRTDAVVEILLDRVDTNELRQRQVAYLSGSVRIWRRGRDIFSRRFSERQVLVSQSASLGNRPESFQAIARAFVRDILDPLPAKVFAE